jgi:hypothetical protein
MSKPELAGREDETPVGKRRLSLEEAAAAYRMSVNTLRSLLQRGVIPATKQGVFWFIHVYDLDDYTREEAKRQAAERKAA